MDLRGFEPLTPWLQIRFGPLLKAIDSGGFWLIESKGVAARMLKIVESQ